MKRYFSIFLLLVFVIGLLPITAQAATEVKEVKLTLEYPEAGKTPPGTATWLTQGYSIYSIDWLDLTTDTYLETGEKIQAGHKYRAVMWVEAMSGYEFACQNSYTPSVKAYVNGKACEAQKAFEYNAWAMVLVNYDFQAIPSKGWIKSVDLAITAPKVGEKPSYPKFDHTSYKSTNMVDLPEYVNGVTWVNTATGASLDPNSKFQAGVKYKVSITVEQKTGYAFVAQPTARVNGQSATTSVDYGTVLFVNFTFPAMEDNHTHFYTDWQYNSGQHYKNCTGCDEVFFVESHKGGAATCQADGKCTVCGYAYIKASEDYHVPDTSKWVSRVDKYHYHPCKLCGAHCDIGDHVAGPTGTPDTAEVCRDCGYIMSPAKNHTHKLTKVAQVPATCTTEGTCEYYKCDGCSDLFTDSTGKNKVLDTVNLTIGALGHSTAEKWQKDESFHWRTCTVCNQVLDETRMAHEFTEETCATCGYKKGSPISQDATEPTKKPPKTAPSKLEREKNDGQNKLLLIIVPLVCFGVAVLATVIILKRKGK